MSDEIRAYLDEAIAAGPKAWLKRKPASTHPDLLDIVRASDDLVYNDQIVDRIVKLENLPSSMREQLQHEVYLARGILSDEQAQERLNALLDDGFEPVDTFKLKDGARYDIACGTLYVGRSVPNYGEPKRNVRAKLHNGRFVFLPKGARTRGFVPVGPALIRPRSLH